MTEKELDVARVTLVHLLLKTYIHLPNFIPLVSTFGFFVVEF